MFYLIYLHRQPNLQPCKLFVPSEIFLQIRFCPIRDAIFLSLTGHRPNIRAMCLSLVWNARRSLSALGFVIGTNYFLPRLNNAVLFYATGRRILRDRPLGRVYVSWLDRERVTPDSRAPIRSVDNKVCIYVLQRYRECHNLDHAFTGFPVVREGEVAFKAFKLANTLLPMAGFASLSAFILKLGKRQRFLYINLPWVLKNGFRAKEIINMYWEEEMERNMGICVINWVLKRHRI
ncbi:uncharacterized protein PgNI_12304 [Pyricularia grisea]|uniref:Coenzyme Q biosynthesis protein 4 n=1 Tax=Pyricularia grisea TaxID=148305 RepID=A0A6P8AMZ6_PYRGI|nr:uncharacterized protein PgNI_12304 [Pyricularia grisea]TLD03412.1 hypothetical protein PgNI_12304 [Pyricularia grisea]